MSDLVLRILSRIVMLYCRFFFQKSNSWPYMSQSSFISLAQKWPNLHSLQEPCSPELISVTHVRTSDINRWLAMNQEHQCKIILIVGNSDDSFTSDIQLPPSIVHVFAQNLDGGKTYNKTLVPIGLEDRRFGRLGLKFLYARQSRNKLLRLLVPPMSPTNPARVHFFQSLTTFNKSELPIDVCVDFLNWISYFRLIKRYKFILCLEGNGYDTHRVWETLYMGAFPVLLRSSFSESLEALGYPVLLVNSLEDVSVAVLKEHFEKNEGFQPKKLPQLWMPYWQSRVARLISPTDT